MAFADKRQASKYIYEYMRDKYDRVNLLLRGGDKERVQAAATRAGQSMSAYIAQAIDERMARESDEH